MNGFELKENIEAIKKSIKENERLLSRSPTTRVPRDSVSTHEIESLPELLMKRDFLLNKLVSFETTQEKFNTLTMLNFNGGKVSLAYCIKMRGMLDRTGSLMQNLVVSGENLSRERAYVDSTNSYIPASLYDDKELKKLPLMVEENDLRISKIKALIAEGNTKIVPEQ